MFIIKKTLEVQLHTEIKERKKKTFKVTIDDRFCFWIMKFTTDNQKVEKSMKKLYK